MSEVFFFSPSKALIFQLYPFYQQYDLQKKKIKILLHKTIPIPLLPNSLTNTFIRFPFYSTLDTFSLPFH